MSELQSAIVTISLGLWVFISILEIFTGQSSAKGKPYTLVIIKIGLVFPVVYLLYEYCGYFNSLEVKSTRVVSEGWTIFLLYIFTVLGMIGHHIFTRLNKVSLSLVEGNSISSKKKKKPSETQLSLQWFLILRPLAVSPIIFSAVLSQFNEMGIQANTLTAVTMQLLLAFQNGFFWETIFSQTQRKIADKEVSKNI